MFDPTYILMSIAAPFVLALLVRRELSRPQEEGLRPSLLTALLGLAVAVGVQKAIALWVMTRHGASGAVPDLLTLERLGLLAGAALATLAYLAASWRRRRGANRGF